MKFVMRTVLLAVLLLIAALATPAFANGALTGTVVGEYGRPEPGVHVVVSPGNQETGTDADGKWSLSLPAGVHYVYFDPYDSDAARAWWTSAGPTTFRSEAQEVHVSEGATTSCDVQLPDGAAISGTVVSEATGGPIPGLSISVHAWDWFLEEWVRVAGVSSDTATYAVGNLMPGLYRLMADPTGAEFRAGFWPAATDIEHGEDIFVGEGAFFAGISPQLKRNVLVDEISGKDRIGTAIEISKKRYPGGSEPSAVVIGTAWNWPDALCGGPLAAAANGPMLLTEKESMSAALLDEVQRLRSLGATKAYILGSGEAVGQGVADQLDLVFGGDNVTRLGGAARWQTSLAIAEEVFALTGARAAYFVSPRSYADAMAVGPQAAQEGAPIIIAQDDAYGPLIWDIQLFLRHDYPPVTRIDEAYIVGDAKAVNDWIERDLKEIVGDEHVRRHAGPNRFETCLALIRNHHNLGRLFVTNGYNYPDALAGGVLAAANEERVLLVNPKAPINAAVDMWLRSLGTSATVDQLTYLGNDKAVQQSTRAEVLDALD